LLAHPGYETDGVIQANKLPSLGPLRVREDAPGRTLIRRIALAVAIIVAVAVMLWIDRDGLQDDTHPDQPPGFVDVFYFTVVSLTTVGYGDITPVSEVARLINALVLTPIRIFLWVLFLGTAYEVSVLRLKFREERLMRDLRERLDRHVIICGYGSKGHAIVDELLAHGNKPENIVVIDVSEAATVECAKRGLVAMRGDASQESLLAAAAVDRAAYVLVATDRDDAATLICLTVRSLAPSVFLVASVRQEENIKLLYGAGANLVVAPAVTGGRLMAAAVRQRAVPYFLEDMIMYGEGLSVSEREVTAAEAGRRVADLPDLKNILVLGVARATRRIPFHLLRDIPLERGDVLVLLEGDAESRGHNRVVPTDPDRTRTSAERS
jgi:voltage-gated potassium channel